MTARIVSLTPNLVDGFVDEGVDFVLVHLYSLVLHRTHRCLNAAQILRGDNPPGCTLALFDVMTYLLKLIWLKMINHLEQFLKVGHVWFAFLN